MSTITEPLRADHAVTEHILTTLQERIGTQKFNAWFKHGTTLQLIDEQVRVTVPNPFVANWIESHYSGEIAESVEAHLGKRCELMITIDPALGTALRKRQLDTQADMVNKSAEGRTRPRNVPQPMRLRHRLDDFVVGESNKLAYSSAVAVAHGRQAGFNPLFIHGKCGVGKTHLLQGICNAASLRRTSGEISWRYVTGEQFTNEFITSLRNKKLHEFRARYRKLGLLAIDDVHFFSSKKATQEEFLHTFNALDTSGAQIVMASDAHPRMVGELNDQLLSRFAAGMVVKIEPPQKETRLQILRSRAKNMKLHIPADVQEYIAQHVRGSVRELEGALVKLGAVASLEGGEVTLAMAREILSEHIARSDSALTVSDIESTVAAFFGITPADLHSSRRTKTVSAARMVAMLLARRYTRMSYPEIGQAMGKNHSSVVLAVQRLEKMLADNKEVAWQTPIGIKSIPSKQLVAMLSEQIA